MRNVFKMFLVPMLLLSAIGAVAQTGETNGNAGPAQENGTATAATVAAARLNEPAGLFMNHLQSDGLLDHVFMKVTRNLAPTHAVSTAAFGCRVFPVDTCAPGLVCCLCVGPSHCETQAQCDLDCQK